MIMHVQDKVFIDHDEQAAPKSLHFRQRTTRYTDPRADGKNLADEDVMPHRPRRLSYIIHHLSLPRLSSKPKSE